MNETTKTTQAVDSGVKVNLPVAIEINHAQLVNLLFGVQGVTFIGAEVTTEPDMNKGGRAHANYMYGNVLKDSTIHCMLGFDYEARRDTLAGKQWVAEAIEAAREAGIDEATIASAMGHLKEYSEQSLEHFEAQPRKWGKHMKNPHTGKVSRVMVDHTKEDKDGNKLPETYKQYMQVEVLGAKTPVYRYKGSGQVLSDADMETVRKYLVKQPADDLVIRDYFIGNIRAIRINRAQYKVTNN